MKVFTPAQAKSAAEERTAKDALRAKGLAEVTQELLQERNKAEKDFEETLKRQQELAEKVYAENLAFKKELEKEVLRLEERRKKALIPLIKLEEDLHSKEEALAAQRKRLGEDRIDLEDEGRVLMRRMDDLSTREQRVHERERRTKLLEEGTMAQKVQVAASARLLNLQMGEFAKSVEDRENGFAYRQSELDARANLIEEKEKGFQARERELQDERRLLIDQRELLQKGFDELRQKQSMTWK